MFAVWATRTAKEEKFAPRRHQQKKAQPYMEIWIVCYCWATGEEGHVTCEQEHIDLNKYAQIPLMHWIFLQHQTIQPLNLRAS